MKTRILAVLALVIATLASPAWAAVNRVQPATEARTPPVQSVGAPARPSYGSRGEERRYAAREAASKNAKQYRAGDYIVISATVAIIILLGIIIILLIT